MSTPTPKPACYWAITGRICGDDEDIPFACGPCTEDEAIREFRIFMRHEESLPTLDGEPDPERDDPEGKSVFVTSIFRSTCLIEIA